ncbi:addiction module antidote protein [Uliginosibacterium sp. sgz301328]|uniref:addiction module antidote protein n=1 Tax=Uliginosibacterium sp. sgz301328 TaxID=3243764 RepID=UPI00359EBA00
MPHNITRFDAVEYLDSDEAIAAYINAALAENDPEHLLVAISTVAKARGIAQLAEASGLGRESLYKTLRPGAKPRFDTVLKVINALGVQLHAEASPSA